MKRKIIIILMAIVSVFACVFGLSACGGSGDVPEKDKPNSGQEQKPGGDEGKEEPAVTVENVGELKIKYGTQLNDFLKEVVLEASVQCSVSNFSENSLLALQFDIGETVATELSSVKTIFNYPGAEGDILYVDEMSFAQPVQLNKIAEYDKNKSELLSAAGKSSVNELYAVTYDPVLTDSGLALALFGKAVGSTQKATLYLKDDGTTPYPVEGGQRMFICRKFLLAAVNDKVTEYTIYVKDSESIEDMLEENSNYKVARTKEKCELNTLVDYKAANYKTVKFNANYEGAKPISDKNFVVGKLMTGLPVPSREGYSFICWIDAFGEEYTSATVMPNENLNLKARWEKIISSYSDEYVSFKPASAGPRDQSLTLEWEGQVDKFVYVEITSDDLGGVSKVGTTNNFTLRTMESMEYKVNSGYTWAWYQGDFDTPNGAQRFTLRYGNNVQLVTVSDSSGVVRQTYLLNIYVKHDYYINLYKNIFEEKPYDKIRVIEGERFSSETPRFDYDNGFEFDARVYYNENTLDYEKFVYSTAIMKDWNLYQTYKSITVATELNGGTLDGQLKITPYTPFFVLPSPVKEGYDFLGWKNEQGKFITNVQGYSGKKYMAYAADTSKPAAFAVPEKLTAEYAENKMYHTFEDEVFKTYKTVPVITYTNELMTDILEIIYVPYGENCVLPVKSTNISKMLFKGWKYYFVSTDGKFGKTPSDFFEEERKINSPVALFPELEPAAGYAVHLNEKNVYSNTGDYVMYLPANERYTLTISTTGSVKIAIHRYGETNNSVTATVTASAPRTFNLDYYVYELGSTVRAHGYVWFDVSSLSGTFMAELTGPTANVKNKPIVTDETNMLAVGEEITLQASEKPGYTFVGWFNGKTKLYDKLTYTFAMPSKNVTYTAKWAKITVVTNMPLAGTVSELTETYYVGDEVTVAIEDKGYMGYNFIGWFNGETKLSDNFSYTFTMPSENATFTAKYELYEGLEGFDFGSSKVMLNITGIKDKTVTEIIVPDYVTSINRGAFSGCSKVESITLPFIGGSNGSVLYSYLGHIFDAPAYTNNYYNVPKSLKSVTITDGIESIADNAFYGCRNLTSITIPESVKNIGSYAFSGCCALTEIIIPANVTVIGKNAFYGCEMLIIYCKTEQILSGWEESWNGSCPIILDCDNNDVDTNGYGYAIIDDVRYSLKDGEATVLMQTAELTKLDIPSEISYKNAMYIVTSIADKAFYNYSSLTDLTMPNSVTYIGTEAFYECSSLKNLTLSDKITYIGGSAFYRCESLTEIILSDELSVLGGSAFADCYKLKYNVYENGYYLGSVNNPYMVLIEKKHSENHVINENTKFLQGNLFNGSNESFALQRLIIPDSVIGVDAEAFRYCYNLYSVVFGTNVEYIASGAFRDSSELETIYFKGTKEEWENVSIDSSYNHYLLSAKRYYYSEEQPMDGGDYWHYVEGAITVWEKQ